MLDAFAYPYMQRALIAGVLIGALCAVIGVYVVLRGLSFIGTGISHASLGGIAIGVAMGQPNPVWITIGFSLLVAWGIGAVAKYGNVREDTAVGIFFVSAQALGILIIGLTKDYQVDLLSYLFGSIIAVTTQDVYMTVVITALVIGCVAFFFKDLMFTIFDPETAKVTGVPADALYFLLLTMMAFTIVISIKVVGIVLVSALIVTPAAAAFQLTESFRKMMALSVCFGVASCLLGLLASDWLRIAPGATIVLIATLNFFICGALSPRRKRGKKRPAVAKS